MAKRRGNIVDVLIILVIIAVVILAVLKMGLVNRGADSEMAEAEQAVTCTALVDKVRMATVNALHEGDMIYDEKTGICIGEITAVSYEPLVYNVPDGSGGTIEAEYPDYYRLYLTIEGNVIEKEDSYLSGGVVEMKVNSEMNTFTKYAMPVIKLTSIGASQENISDGDNM